MAQKSNVDFILKILIVLILDSFMCCIASQTKLNISKVSTTPDENSVFPSTQRTSKFPPEKKWQVGRVSRKQYEIVNMLWRKTKIFEYPETTNSLENRFGRSNVQTTNGHKIIKARAYTTFRPSSSTASYIEFYYLDDNDERVKHRDAFIPALGKPHNRRQLSNKHTFLQSPTLAFHVSDIWKSVTKRILSTDKQTTTKNQKRHKPQVNQKLSVYGFLSNGFSTGPELMSKPQIKNNHITATTTSYETCPSTTLDPDDNTNITMNFETQHHDKVTFEETDVETIAYDKIKFFEIYDDHTTRHINNIEKAILKADDSENMVRQEDSVVSQRSYLEDVHQIIGHHDTNKIKNVKNHIDHNIGLQNIASIISTTSKDEAEENETKEKKLKFKTVFFNVNKTSALHRNLPENSSREALWSAYPFAAVYIYEPSQIHCDAAALSPHWLIAAGSCLSRFHTKDPETEGRSAFVTYCGQSWWQPERRAYVKYSIVHPRFNPKDNARRYLYNIGLVQVVGSMSACSGWAPISLMSHHFAASSDGSIATAVGWGLDRYDVRYSSMVLPRRLLSAFDSFVYSESCPGSTAFGKGKSINAESIQNLYCLSLPPYHGEQNDPVHGSLLLVGGKLIALYLQEERRIWGAQSAQYTGVWRVVPWIHEVAREPEETDSFAIDL